MHLRNYSTYAPTMFVWMFLVFCFDAVSLRVSAHEFWLSPSSHHASIGATVEVYAMIGHGEKAEALVRRRDHLKTFLVHEGQNSEELSGRNRRHPTGKFRPKSDGLHIVAYESLPQTNSLPGDQFEAYLRKEGLEEVLDSRRDSKKSEELGREIYSRYAKCLIQVGAKPGADRALGFPLEIISLTDPSKLSVGSTLVVQILRDGDPIPGLLVKAFSLASVHHGVVPQNNK
ncbi:DUF4198 domain-containing protein [bacterium]|nr:DUF4198 domain-containing protein [bacterium]MDA7645177.1 DUF4198 domain-containing protein [bacterium]